MNDAKIYSQGYRRYDGERTGLPGAIRSLQKQSLREALGMRRPARHKIIPILIILFSYLPAIGFVGFAIVAKTFGGDTIGDIAKDIIPDYADFYGLTNFAVIVLAGLVIPSLLCSDKRNGMLGVYLSSPLNRASYMIGKLWASFLILLTVTLGPPLLLLIALSLQGFGPESFSDWIKTFGQIVMGSSLIGLFYVLISMAISTFTDRRNIASVIFFAILFGSSAVIAIVQDVTEITFIRLLNPLLVPLRLVQRVFGTEGGWTYADNSTFSIWISWIAFTGISILILWVSYRRLLVRR